MANNIDIIDIVSDLEAWLDNLFACKAAIFTGEIEGRTADNALAVVHNGIKEIADKLSEINGNSKTNDIVKQEGR